MPKAIVFLVLFLPALLDAQTAAPDAAIPPALRDWRAWSMKDLEYRACPFLASSSAKSPGDFVCAWPGRLTLASAADGAGFSVHWHVEAPSWIMLPGDGEHWPQQVAANAQHVPVLLHGGRPALWLTPGTYEINGRIPWRERPQSLAVPQAIGLVTLTVDGRPIVPLQRDGDSVTLGRAQAVAPEADSLDLRVYRKLADGVPAQLTSNIVFAVSGQAREEIVGPALPPGFAPVELTSTWPARLDGDGKLRVQVQPGSETIVLEARATAPLTSVTAQLPAAPWPQQEIWSYEAAPRLRVTVAGGVVQVDPRQAEVPAEWMSLPAFALGNSAKLAVEERSRGLAPDESNRLTLQREAWLDFSGDGWYARDLLSGNMATGWRFDVAAPFTLEQATARNSARERGGEPLLITRGASADLSGVEWRTPRVELAAGVRIAAPAAMAVAGWRQTFDSVQATLHFPFGYKLLAAPGADSAAGSWAAGWTLLDAFVCAIAVLLAWRLFAAAGVAAVAVFLLLAYQESGVPLWSLIAAFGLSLIARALPAGRLSRWAEGLRRAALVALVLMALPFAAAQLRYALYPQLENEGYAAAYPMQVGYQQKTVAGQAENAPAAMNEEMRQAPGAPAPARDLPAPPAPLQAEMATAAPQVLHRAKREAKPAAKALALDTLVVTGSRIDRSSQIEHYAETTVVQTGAGAPSWTLGSTAWLSWTGPVLATQDVRLLIAPPLIVRPLRALLVALLAWLVWRLLQAAGVSGPRRGPAGGAAAALLFAGLIAAPAVQAQAYPSGELVQQLRQRLSEAPPCAPACATLAEAQVTASGDTVGVMLEAHVGERVALPLPDDASGAALKSVQVDGAAVDAIARDAAGHLWIAVPRGVHRIALDFAAPGDKVALAFPLQPERVLFQGKGWDAAGLADDRLLTETLTLARAHDNAAATAGAGVQQFPPFVRVERQISLGLEWAVSTNVMRMSPAKGGFAVDVPLLAGEHVASNGIKVQNGKVQAALADQADSTGWRSTLDKADSVTLTAPALAERAETWNVLISPTWHVEFAGVPLTGGSANDNGDDYRNFEFHPLPGETLTLRITRPVAAQGAARAIDAVDLGSEAGQRAASDVLRFTLRASQGGEQAITLPKDAEVLAVSRDGVALNVRALDGKISLPVAPGTQHYEVRLRRSDQAGTSVRTPAIALGLPAANIALSLQLPADRWLLATWGPGAGPAVLYWGELLVMIGLAFALARTRRTRLRFRDWLLLGLGFSTFSWIALLIVVAWLFAFEWRARATLPQAYWRFNLLQAALVLLTIVAVLALVSAIPQGLLGQPDMHVTGNGSYDNVLHWFADRSADALPAAHAISLPLWVYKVLMLAWALWLANTLIGWLRAAFTAWMRDGYWRSRPKPAPTSAAAPPVDAATP